MKCHHIDKIFFLNSLKVNFYLKFGQRMVEEIRYRSWMHESASPVTISIKA